MTFRRALTVGRLGLLLVGVVILVSGCSEVPEEVRRADACRTYERNYQTMNRQDQGRTMGVYLAARIAECERDGYL